jgi:hypothetical protein
VVEEVPVALLAPPELLKSELLGPGVGLVRGGLLWLHHVRRVHRGPPYPDLCLDRLCERGGLRRGILQWSRMSDVSTGAPGGHAHNHHRVERPGNVVAGTYPPYMHQPKRVQQREVDSLLHMAFLPVG